MAHSRANSSQSTLFRATTHFWAMQTVPTDHMPYAEQCRKKMDDPRPITELSVDARQSLVNSRDSEPPHPARPNPGACTPWDSIHRPSITGLPIFPLWTSTGRTKVCPGNSGNMRLPLSHSVHYVVLALPPFRAHARRRPIRPRRSLAELRSKKSVVRATTGG